MDSEKGFNPEETKEKGKGVVVTEAVREALPDMSDEDRELVVERVNADPETEEMMKFLVENEASAEILQISLLGAITEEGRKKMEEEGNEEAQQQEIEGLLEKSEDSERLKEIMDLGKTAHYYETGLKSWREVA